MVRVIDTHSAAMDAFGASRCMIGSDWPVSAATPHRMEPGEWFGLVSVDLGASADELEQIGWHTASTFYGIASAS